jgi:hypothetical protein
MTQPWGHELSEGYPLTTSTQSFPAQRGRGAGTGADYHDHAWRQVEEPDRPLLLGSYRCDLCHVVWEL